MDNKRKLSHVHRLCDDRDFVRIVSTAGYAEPGYEDKFCVVVGNWNDKTRWDNTTDRSVVIDSAPGQIAKKLELLGCELEWEDEWDECCECHKLVRTKPDSYGWKPSYWRDDNGEVVCHKCTKKDPTEYLESLEGKSETALTLDIDLAEHEYIKLDQEFERGLHPAQADDPRVIAKWLKARGITRFIFELESVGQFDASFCVWVHNDEWTEGLVVEDTKSAESPATIMERGLRNASLQAPANGSGISVTAIDIDTGESVTRSVSREDFIAGKALKG